MLYNINITRKMNEVKITIRTLLEKSLGTTKYKTNETKNTKTQKIKILSRTKKIK